MFSFVFYLGSSFNLTSNFEVVMSDWDGIIMFLCLLSYFWHWVWKSLLLALSWVIILYLAINLAISGTEFNCSLNSGNEFTCNRISCTHHYHHLISIFFHGSDGICWCRFASVRCPSCPQILSVSKQSNIFS